MEPVAPATRFGVRRGERPDLLRALPLFSRVDDAELTALAACTRAHRLLRGQVLFHRGDPAHGFFVLIDGVIKLAVQGPDGSEKVLEVIQPGESFGEAMMLLAEPYPVTATALEPARLLAVPIEAVERLLRDPMFARRMLAGMAFRLRTMVRDVESYTLRSSRERVVAYLVASADHTPSRAVVGTGEGTERVVVLPTSKQVTASRLNLTPETFSRVLRELSEQGLVRVDGRRIVVSDPAALSGWDG